MNCQNLDFVWGGNRYGKASCQVVVVDTDKKVFEYKLLLLPNESQAIQYQNLLSMTGYIKKHLYDKYLL